MKLTVKQINEITTQMGRLELENIAFADFEFNMNLGILYSETSTISSAYDKALSATIKAARDKGIVADQDQIFALLEKTHEIDVPEITVELLKKTGIPLPTSAMAMFIKYLKKDSSNKK